MVRLLPLLTVALLVLTIMTTLLTVSLAAEEDPLELEAVLSAYDENNNTGGFDDDGFDDDGFDDDEFSGGNTEGTLWPSNQHTGLQQSAYEDEDEAETRALAKRMQRVTTRDKRLNPSYEKFMRDAMVTKMDVQEIDTTRNTLVLGGTTVSLKNSDLQRLKLSTDGRNKNVYRCAVRDRRDPNAIAHVLKRSGVVYSVTLYRPSTGISITATPVPGMPNKYATFSAEDWDEKRMSVFLYDRVIRIRPNVFESKQEHPLVSHVSGGGRRHLRRELQSGGTCSGYRVVRVDFRFDSDFCEAHGGKQAAIDRIHAIVAEANIPFGKSPLCMKIETCNVDGFCQSGGDPYRNMIDSSTVLCNSFSSISALDRFAARINDPSDALALKPQCDAAHLMFDGKVASLDVTGCGTIGALCNSGAVSASRTGVHAQNLAIQAGIVTHELGHNIGAEHDDANSGHVMDILNCAGCTTFSPVSIRDMVRYVDNVDNNSCIAFEPAVSATRANNQCLGRYTQWDECNKADDNLCSWHKDRRECWERSDMECSDFGGRNTCMWHGQSCVWRGGQCDDPCSDLRGSACDDSRFCTWQADKGQCRIRHKTKCRVYEDRFRCLEHGSFCSWEGNSCSDLSRPPPTSSNECGKFYSSIFCNRDRFDICSWDSNRGTCRHRAAMDCSDFTKDKFCERHGTNCRWNAGRCQSA